MTPLPFPTESRLDYLFVRYWDDALSAEEAVELVELLRTDPAARRQFQLYCVQAVTAGDRKAVARSTPVSATPACPRPAGRLLSRRAWLWRSGAGLACGITGMLVGRRVLSTPPATVQVTALRGLVKVHAPDEGLVAVGGVVPPGGRISTLGPRSSALLAYPDGSSVSITGDAEATVGPDGWHLVLHKGNAAAEVRPHPSDDPAFTLSTDEAELTARGGASVIVERLGKATEIGVQRGSVTAAGPAGTRAEQVADGQMLTVRADSRHRQPLPVPRDEFAWDLTAPELPAGWHVGTRVEDGPAIRAEQYPDPYYGRVEMYQIRSDKHWTRGMVLIHPESVIRVRYKVERPSDTGQLCVCVRTTRSGVPDSGVLEWNGVFADARPGVWEVKDVRAGDMLANRHAPSFPGPWVGFLVIFNTYETDLGLVVSEFRVSRPGRA